MPLKDRHTELHPDVRRQIRLHQIRVDQTKHLIAERVLLTRALAKRSRDILANADAAGQRAGRTLLLVLMIVVLLGALVARVMITGA